MNEEEVIFNKLHDIFKNTVENKRTLKVIECAEIVNVSKEKIRELINVERGDLEW